MTEYPATPENQVVVDVTRQGTTPTKLADGIWLTQIGQQHVDLRKQLEQGQARPDRKKGDYVVTDVESFVAYVAKHGLSESELWANDKASTVTAVVNAHLGATEDGIEDFAGWSDHKIALRLDLTKDWQEWAKGDGVLVDQAGFAEFIEDHLPNFVAPSAADMLELAQTFQATTKVDFASSQRVKSGETQINYVENTSATAGKKGALEIPDTFTVALQPYERGKVYRLEARFRYRINGGELRLGYRLTRPDDVLRDAFDAVVTEVATGTDRDVWSTR